MIDESRLVELFRNLCLIDAPALGERDVVTWTTEYLKRIGLDVWDDDAGARIGGNANNVIARLSGNDPNAPKIFFSAHFDTVEPTAGLVIEERDGVFVSASDTILGADDKAGMAPAIEAVNVLSESSERRGDVYLLLSVAEEIGLKGAKALHIEKLGLDFGYVLDTGPPVGTYVVRTATHDIMDVRVIGKPAHAGKDPEKGINAIQVAAEAIARMRIGRVGPETTANIGSIHGGSATNVVCPEVQLRCEARGTNLVDLQEQVDHMMQEFERAAADRGASVHIEHERQYEAYRIEPTERVVEVARRASESLGFEPVARTTLGGSDANIFNAKGVPTIVLGTGMEKIHTHEEYVSRRDLVDLTRLVLAIVREACA